METKVLHIDPGHPNRPGTLIKKVTGVVVHWTANESRGAHAVANRNYFNRTPTSNFAHASAHLIVDDHMLVEALPWKRGEAEIGWHVGAKTYIPGILEKLGTTYPNDSTIGLEICVNSDGNFAQTWWNAVRVTAIMLHEHRLGMDALIRHYDVTGKECPKFFIPNASGDSYAAKYLGDGWNAWGAYESFKYSVNEELTSLQGGSQPSVPTDLSLKHERIYVANGELQYVDLNGTKPYSVKATDVRLLTIPKDKYELKLVWAKGQKVSDLVKEHGAIYGFNFPFFWEGNPIADCKIGSQILNYGYDKQTTWHGFYYYNGKPGIGQIDINTDVGEDGFIVKTTPLLLDGEGRECWDWFRIQEGTASDIGMNGSGYVSAQRTFVGLTTDGDLLVGIADGRTSSDKGLTLEEMAKYMKANGAVWALNGDGGGSTILADQNGGLNQNLNIGSNERPVNHAILVFPKREEAPVQEQPTETAQEYYRVYQNNRQAGAFLNIENAESLAKELYRQSRSDTIVVHDPNGNVIYTPSKHPEDFPEIVIESMDEATQKAVYEILKAKFG